nr:MAG TPA: hypothetical protein [Caudoviricetes sp.]DAZ82659.1 MAG TPA: hypothetical protein [Caudoviricetes sp.]
MSICFEKKLYAFYASKKEKWRRDNPPPLFVF